MHVLRILSFGRTELMKMFVEAQQSLPASNVLCCSAPIMTENEINILQKTNRQLVGLFVGVKFWVTYPLGGWVVSDHLRDNSTDLGSNIHQHPKLLIFCTTPHCGTTLSAGHFQGSTVYDDYKCFHVDKCELRQKICRKIFRSDNGTMFVSPGTRHTTLFQHS